MNKSQAKREACGMVCSFISADIQAVIEAAGFDGPDDDLERITDAMEQLATELALRSQGIFYSPKQRKHRRDTDHA